MSWWTDNGYQDITAPTTGSQPLNDPASQITAWYQQYLGRTPSAQELQSQEGNPGGLPAVQSLIQNSPEAQTYAKTNGPNAGPPTLNPSDPNSVNAFIGYYAKQPGANPSLTADPGYWAQKISSGALGSDSNYIVQKFMTPEGQPAASAGAPGALPQSGYGGFGIAPAPYTPPSSTPPTPPTPAPYSGPSVPGAPTLTPFTAPTAADLQASPGYASMLAAGLKAQNSSAAAQGTVLNGGTQKALQQYSQDYANTGYNNLFTQDLSTNQNNNNLSQTNYQDLLGSYNAAYGQYQGGVQQGQQAYQNQYTSYLDANSSALNNYLANVSTQRNAGNDYWSQLQSLYNTGAGIAGNTSTVTTTA